MTEKEHYPNLLKLQPQLCIAGQIMKCNRLILKVFRKHIGKHQLSNSQLSILFITAKKGIISQTALSEMLFLEKSTVSRNMQRLLNQEYIERATTMKKAIAITEKGKSFLEIVIPDWEKAMAEIKEQLGTEGENALAILLSNLTL